MVIKTKFMVSDTTVNMFKISDEALLDKLPPRVYILKFSKLQGFYFEILNDKFEVPNRIYGGVSDRVGKCLHTYKSRSSSTGVLLTGDKGTGKSLMMAELANKAIQELEIPVIVIKQAYAGEQFTSFIESVGECCLVFDEFGKMYSALNRPHGDDDVPQKHLLSLLDGVNKTKRMVIMTENDEMNISEFMLNRPSRIFYHFKYKKMGEESIKGYCKDNNIRDEVVQEILDLSRRSKLFSFDMLQAIVEEHTRFGTDISSTVEELNIDVREDAVDKIEILKVIHNNTEKECNVIGSRIFTYPDRHGLYVHIATEGLVDDTIDTDKDGYYVEVYGSDLSYSADDQRVYNTEQFTVIAKVIKQQSFDYKRFLA